MEQNSQSDSEKSNQQLTKTAIVVYSLMSLLGVGAIIIFGNQKLELFFGYPKDNGEWVRWISLCTASCALIYSTSSLVDMYFPSYRQTKIELATIFGNPSFFQIFILAAFSSIGEELLFRGAIQPHFGIALTSLVFGLMHLAPGGSISMWTVLASGAGVVLGLLLDQTGSLLPPIFCHFLINLIGLHELKRLRSMSSKNQDSFR